MDGDKETTAPDEKVGPAPGGGSPFRLVDVRTRQIHAEIHGSTGEDDAQTPEGQEDQSSEAKSQIPANIDLLLPKADARNEFNVGLRFNTEHARVGETSFSLLVLLEGRFACTDSGDSLDPEELVRFKEHQVFPILLPYLREAVHDMSERMRLGIPQLPIFAPGDLVFRDVGE